jgi:hypothetical protein
MCVHNLLMLHVRTSVTTRSRYPEYWSGDCGVPSGGMIKEARTDAQAQCILVDDGCCGSPCRHLLCPVGQQLGVTST